MEKEKARLKADISFLASDQLGGRQTGSSGELSSATYIRNEFKKNKLSPKRGDHSVLNQTSYLELPILAG